MNGRGSDFEAREIESRAMCCSTIPSDVGEYDTGRIRLNAVDD